MDLDFLLFFFGAQIILSFSYRFYLLFPLELNAVHFSTYNISTHTHTHTSIHGIEVSCWNSTFPVLVIPFLLSSPSHLISPPCHLLSSSSLLSSLIFLFSSVFYYSPVLFSYVFYFTHLSCLVLSHLNLSYHFLLIDLIPCIVSSQLISSYLISSQLNPFLYLHVLQRDIDSGHRIISSLTIVSLWKDKHRKNESYKYEYQLLTIINIEIITIGILSWYKAVEQMIQIIFRGYDEWIKKKSIRNFTDTILNIKMNDYNIQLKNKPW